MCCCPLPEDQFGLKRIFGYVLGMGELHGDWSLRSDHGDRNGPARAGAGALVTAATDGLSATTLLVLPPLSRLVRGNNDWSQWRSASIEDQTHVVTAVCSWRTLAVGIEIERPNDVTASGPVRFRSAERFKR